MAIAHSLDHYNAARQATVAASMGENARSISFFFSPTALTQLADLPPRATRKVARAERKAKLCSATNQKTCLVNLDTFARTNGASTFANGER